MPSIRQLYSLQGLDRELDSRQARLVAVQQQLGDERTLDELRGQIEALEGELHRLRAEQKALELEGDQPRQKAVEVEARLFSGAVRNPRELSDLQEELRQLRVRQEPAEDAALKLMEQGDDLEKELQSLRVQLQAATEQWQEEQAALLQEGIRLEGEVAALQGQRQELAATVESLALSLYNQLRRSLNGYAVALVERGLCLGCRLTLPTHQLRQARSGRELVQCTSCLRILYVS